MVNGISVELVKYGGEWQNGMMPYNTKEWKKSHISSTYKKGDRRDSKNYNFSKNNIKIRI